jgi:hypothetical protein
VPWKALPDVTGTVESEFIWPTLLGEQIVPFRVLAPAEFVLPLTASGELLSGDHPRIDAYPGVATWTRSVEASWTRIKGGNVTLSNQINHMNKLTQQFPIPTTRVVYAASGMHVSATIVSDSRTVVEHGAYWAAVTSQDEAAFLIGILNAPILTELVRPLMSYSKDERHIDKHVWKLPIPTYDPDETSHQRIRELAQELVNEVAGLEFRSTNFVMIRRDIRDYLSFSSAGKELDQVVQGVLGSLPT